MQLGRVVEIVYRAIIEGVIFILKNISIIKKYFLVGTAILTKLRQRL